MGIDIGWLENTKGTIDEYMWSHHGSVVEVHVGAGAEQQELLNGLERL